MNRRNVLRGLLATGAMCGLHGMGAADLCAASPRVIPMTTHYSLQHPVTQEIFIPWANDLRTRSEGKLDVRVVAPDVLCPDENVYNAILTNTVTLGGFVPNMMISHLPVSRLMGYALLYPNARSGSQMVWDTLANSQHLREDLALVHTLWAWISPGAYLHTTGRVIRNLDDIRHMKVVVWDTATASLATALGAQPVFSPSHFSVNMLRMQMAEAVIAPFATLEVFGLLPVLKCTLDIPLTNVCFFAGFNREVWSVLSAQERHLLESTTGERMAAACGGLLDMKAAQMRARMEQQGHTFMTLSNNDLSAVYSPLLALRDAHEQALIDNNLLPKEGLLPLLRLARERVLQR